MKFLITARSRFDANAWLLVALLVIAIMVSPRVPLPFELSGGRVVELRLGDGLAVILGTILVGTVWNSEIYLSRIFVGTSLWLGYGMLLTLTLMALDQADHLRAAIYSMKELQYVLYFLLAANWIRNERDLEKLVRIILAIGLLSLVWGLATFYVGTKLMLGTHVAGWLGQPVTERITASYGITTIGEASAFGVCMFYAFLSFLALSCTINRERQQVPYMLLYLLFSIAMLLTGEKIALGLLAIGIVGLLVVDRSVRAIKVVSLLLIPVAIMMLFIYLTTSESNFLKRIFHLHGYSINEDRLSRWRVIWAGVQSNPLGGVGKGQMYLIPGDGHVEEYHSHYIKTLAETGVIGLALWIVWIGSVLKSLWTGYKSTASVTRVINGAVFVSALGLSFAGLVQDAFKTILPNSMFWLFLGLAAATWRFTSVSREDQGTRSETRER